MCHEPKNTETTEKNNDVTVILQVCKNMPDGEDVSMNDVNKWVRIDKYDTVFEILRDNGTCADVIEKLHNFFYEVR